MASTVVSVPRIFQFLVDLQIVKLEPRNLLFWQDVTSCPAMNCHNLMRPCRFLRFCIYEMTHARIFPLITRSCDNCMRCYQSASFKRDITEIALRVTSERSNTCFINEEMFFKMV